MHEMSSTVWGHFQAFRMKNSNTAVVFLSLPIAAILDPFWQFRDPVSARPIYSKDTFLLVSKSCNHEEASGGPLPSTRPPSLDHVWSHYQTFNILLSTFKDFLLWQHLAFISLRWIKRAKKKWLGGSISVEGEVIFKLNVETDITHEDTLSVLLALYYFYYSF